MVLTWVISVSAAIFAVIGAGSLFLGLLSKGALRSPSLRASCYAFGAAGGLLLAGGVFGGLGSDEIIMGILLLTFATSMTPSGKKSALPVRDQDTD